jgi:hypothetical protein
MSRRVIYRSEFITNKKDYANLCKLYIIKHKFETQEDCNKMCPKTIIKKAHECHQNRLLDKCQPIKLKKKCSNFCEGWYISDNKCACGEKNVSLKNVSIEYQNFTILDTKYSGTIHSH